MTATLRNNAVLKLTGFLQHVHRALLYPKGIATTFCYYMQYAHCLLYFNTDSITTHIYGPYKHNGYTKQKGQGRSWQQEELP
jgi:hypothetical protein